MVGGIKAITTFVVCDKIIYCIFKKVQISMFPTINIRHINSKCHAKSYAQC